MSAKTFEEWMHNNLENHHEPKSRAGWLKAAWDAAIQSKEAVKTSHNIDSKAEAQICELDKAIMCLAIVVDQQVFKEISAKWRDVRKLLTA